MKHILVIDDDIHIGNMLEEVLIKEGYNVSRAYSGTEALLILSSSVPDLVLLDLMLPGLNGEEVLKHISGIPVIVVSARAQVNDKVDLLLGGAVDYVTKPFDMSELLARIQVHLRNSSKLVDSSLIKFSNIVLDTAMHTISVNNILVKLTRTEYAIMKMLMLNPEQVITKSQLLDSICEDTPDCTDSSLKIHISNIRKKIRDISGNDYIESVWGIGFRLTIA